MGKRKNKLGMSFTNRYRGKAYLAHKQNDEVKQVVGVKHNFARKKGTQPNKPSGRSIQAKLPRPQAKWRVAK